MTAAGKIVLHSGGKVGVLLSGKTAVFDSAGACPECCEPDPCETCGVPQAAITIAGHGDPEFSDPINVPFENFVSLTCIWDWLTGDQFIYISVQLIYVGGIGGGWSLAVRVRGSDDKTYSTDYTGSSLSAVCGSDGVLVITATLAYEFDEHDTITVTL